MGENILLLDVQGISSVADYYVIATCQTERQLKSMARDLSVLSTSKRGQLLRGLEKQAEGGWVLLDFEDVLVHLFSADQRDYYNLEELWEEGKVVLKLQ